MPKTPELIARSPCRRIRLPQLAPRLAEILDADALGPTGAAMGRHGPMVYLGAFGLRWGEIAGLRVSRLDFLAPHGCHRSTTDPRPSRPHDRE